MDVLTSVQASNESERAAQVPRLNNFICNHYPIPDPLPLNMSIRYLVPFHPKSVPHFFTDVLVIGSGLAGLRAALAIDPSLSVVMITKDGVVQSNSNVAQGGIAGVLDPADRFENHVQDTLVAGGSLCDRQVVEHVVRQSPRRIQELIDWGVQFDQAGERLALAREGGHSRDRIAHALGDATGKEIMRVVIRRVQESAQRIYLGKHIHHRSVDPRRRMPRGAGLERPARQDHGLGEADDSGQRRGGPGLSRNHQSRGGHRRRHGHGLSGGAELRDMEFMQFHPTVLYIAGGSRHLISEATRGAGAWLVDRHGRRFMTDYDPRGELAPRDVVSLAIVCQMEKTRHPNVYLDLTHLDAGLGSRPISGHSRRVRRIRFGHYPRPHSRPAGGALHDGRS